GVGFFIINVINDPRCSNHADSSFWYFFFFQAEDGIRDRNVTGVQTCALPISTGSGRTFPSRPVRLVVPFAAGGVTDTSARTVADPLGARLGQPVVVENRPGASGNIGTEQVARSAPDGHTLLLGFDGTMVINPHVFAKIPFDTLRDFAPVTKLGDATLILVAHPSVPANSLQ